MRKITLTILSLMVFGYASAQDETTEGKGFNSGDIFISGSVGIGSQKTDNYKITNFEIAPKLGFFVSDNIAIGGVLRYYGSKQDYTQSGETKTYNIGVGAFGRYYATPKSDFSFFGELSAMHLTERAEGQTNRKSTGFEIALSPGVSYFLSENFALEASIGLLNFNTLTDSRSDEKRDSFNAGVRLSNILMGLVYKF